MQNKNRIDQYLDAVCGEIKAKGMHSEIRKELGGHLEDVVFERVKLGATTEEAEIAAIAQMGDPIAVGRDLHQIHKPATPWSLLGIMLLFSAVGLLGMSSVDASPLDTKLPESLLYRQTIFMVMGIILMTIFYFSDFRRLRKLSWLLYGCSIAGIGATLTLGIVSSGARYYLYIAVGGFVFDTVSYSPYLLLVALAGIFSMQQANGKLGTKQNRLTELMILFAPVLVYVIAGILPEMILYLLCSLVLYAWLSGAWRRSLIAGGGFMAAGLAYVWRNDQMKDRILGAVDYRINPDSSGFIYKSLQEAVASAGWRGHGFGAGLENLSYVYSDMLPVYLIYSFGWGGGLVLLGIMLWFFIRLFSSFRAVNDRYGKAIVIVLSLMIAVKLLYGLLVISGRMVLTSLPFPFMSYGTHVLIEYAALGLVMGIYRRKDISPAASEHLAV